MIMCDCNQGRQPCTCKVSILKEANATYAASSGAAPVLKFKPLGEMVQRSRVGGGSFVRLEDYEKLQAECSAALFKLAEQIVALERPAPVPPAGDVELQRYDMSGFGDGMVENADGAFVYFDDHSAHVTRLTAERDEALAEVEKWQGVAGRRTAERTELLNERNDAQSELTKARELFEDMLRDDDMPVHWFAQRISEVTDAPAAKGGE